MELDSLKSNWKDIGQGQKNQTELWMMTKMKNHPTLKRIQIKLIIETILIVVFLAVYYDGFDGATKPLWANIVLVSATSAYIVTRFMGWLVLRNPIKEGDLKSSLTSFQSTLKRMALSVLCTSFLFGVAIISFFASGVDLSRGKYFAFAGMMITLILLVYLSSRNWLKRLKEIKTTLSEWEKVDG